MKYIQWTLAKLSEIKNRLFVLQDKEKEPLSRFSIAVILLLDVFLFINIFVGIEEQSNTVDRPSDFVSYVCQNNARIYSKKDISVVDSLANMFSGNRSPYLQRDSSESLDCQGIQKALDEAGQNPILISLFDEREAIQANLLAINNQISRKEQDISRVRSSYDTKLLEKIAGQERQYQLDAGTAETAKSETLKHQEALSGFISERSRIQHSLEQKNQEILQSPALQELIAKIGPKAIRAMEDYENLSFWYPIKRTGVEALFLLPLLICVGVWANFAMRKGRTYQILISSHLLTIIGIFLLLRAVTLIYDIIPKVFLAKLIDFLEVLNIVGLLYYFWILFAVLFTLGLVYFVQRRIAKAKEARKLEIGAKRAEKGECWACGAKLTGGHHCIRCGTSQFIACSNCGKDTLRAGEHCMHCGTSITHQ